MFGVSGISQTNITQIALFCYHCHEILTEFERIFFWPYFWLFLYKRNLMFRKLIFITLSLTLAIGISSATFSDSQPKPTKKAAKKTKAKKSNDDDSKPAVANTEKITWYSMTDGFAKAKKEKKVLVVDVYTDWCYWCKVMDKLTYENKSIVTKMRKYAVAVKFNPEVNANHTVNGQVMNSDQLGLYLNKGGRIPGYPMTFVWKDLSNSSKIEPYSGYMDTTTFNAVLNKSIQE